MKTMKQKLLLFPTQLGGQYFREYENLERKTLVELVREIRRKPLANLRKYHQIKFLVTDVTQIRRLLLTEVVLKWSAKYVQIEDLRGAKFRLGWLSISKSVFYFLKELCLSRQIGKRAKKEVGGIASFSGRASGNFFHMGKVIYIRGGKAQKVRPEVQ